MATIEERLRALEAVVGNQVAGIDRVEHDRKREVIKRRARAIEDGRDPANEEETRP